MKITAFPHAKAFKELKISHGTRYIPWQTRAYESSTLNKDFDNLFKPLNDFLETCLTEDEKESIWNSYVAIYQEIEDGGDLSILTNIQVHVADIFEIITFERVKSFVENQTYLLYPPAIQTALPPHDMGAIGKTYLRHHYTDLIVFSIMAKALVPMFGTLIRTVKDLVVNDKKEYVTMRIVDKAHGFLSNPATEKLRNYIYENFHKGASDSNLLHAGISTHEHDEYLFAHVVVKRIAVSSLLLRDESLVANIYNVLDRHTIAKGRKKSEFVKNKANGDQYASDTEGDRAIRDGYKVKQKMSFTVIVEAECWMAEYFDVQQLEPKVTKLLMTRCHGNAKRLAYANLHDYKLVLIAAVMCAYVPVINGIPTSKLLHIKILRLVNRDTAIHMLAVTQAVLYTWGFKLLANILTADSNEELSSTQTLSARSPAIRRMAHQPRDRLNVLYSHHRKTPTALGLKGTSPGEHTIHRFLTSISMYDLYYNSPTCIMPEIDDMSNRLHLPPTNELRDDLIELILKVKG